jgi:hypothetical protein
MRFYKFLMLSLVAGIGFTSCTKNTTKDYVPAPVMNRQYFAPAYVTDQTAPNARINVAITATAGMYDAIYHSIGVPAAGVTFTLKDETGATLTTLTGVPQVPTGATILQDQSYIVNLPSSFTIPAAWLGKIVTITASNSSTALTKYKIVP